MAGYIDIAKQVIHAKRFEPRQRNKDGVRWIGHRFPIKGGISLREVWIREMCRPNPLMDIPFVRKDN